jgi:MotA/TolQ/ExbB proton channel family
MTFGFWSRLRARAPRNAHATNADDVFLHWLVLMGVLVFVGVVMWWRGAWQALNTADPTGITQLITLVFFVALLWCGARAWTLRNEMHALNRSIPAAQNWASEYLFSLKNPGADRDALAELLTEKASGSHETAWWFNGLLLKLGLLGTVVGFILMAFTVANFDAFDVEKAQVLLRNMTRGMGVALLTTLVGLIGNMILGWQLLQLDRTADALVSQTVKKGMSSGI